MVNIVKLDREAHGALRVDNAVSARYGDNQRFVPVLIREFPFLTAQYPVLVGKNSETGALYCGTVLGFDDGENLFLADHGAQTAYRPLHLRRLPFYAAGTDLAIDLDHPRLGAEGRSLFDADGKPSDYLETIAAIFRELHDGTEETQAFLARLVELKLIEPVEFDLAFDDGNRRQVTGLYTVDQEALQALPDADALDLFRRGWLQAAYLLSASLKQIPLLAQRKNRQWLEPSMA